MLKNHLTSRPISMVQTQHFQKKMLSTNIKVRMVVFDKAHSISFEIWEQVKFGGDFQIFLGFENFRRSQDLEDVP